jgi:large repetitive protein
MRTFPFLCFLISCAEDVKVDTDPLSEDGELLVDEDGDGYLSDDDCDDNDATINPSSEELCDGYDNNCNGLADEDVTTTYYADSDSDGFGSEDIATQACEAPSGYVSNGSDCDDTDSSSYPSAEEVCDDADNDCNGEVDDGLGQFFYVDSDGDGFGNEEEEQEACDLSIGLSAVGGDCNDSDASISPASVELCDELDNNCNGETDEGAAEIYYADQDTDGYGDAENTTEACDLPDGYVQNTLDCNDNDTQINPAADEFCDGQDNDCDEVIDEDLSADALLFYADEDEDGYGDGSNTAFSCAQPEGYTTNSDDCDDNSVTVNPQGTEYCNGQDDDCDGETDEDGALGYDEFYADYDGDGFGDADSIRLSCEAPGDHVENDEDCDDNDNDVSPDAEENCDGIDNNCDGVVDEDDAADAMLWYADQDGDGFGDPSQSASSCAEPEGHVSNSADCDDADASTTDGTLFYWDSDGDGFGSDSLTSQACALPLGFSENSDDCDDGDDDINPDAEESCNELDDNCDGSIDEDSALDVSVWHPDADQDGHGDAELSVDACSQPDGYVSDGSDCDDHDDDINPGADELCNGEDDDCDGDTDGGAVDGLLLYVDGDGDGYGSGEGTTSCETEAGLSVEAGDCDDGDGDVFPGADELCDSVDNDCDDDIDGGALDSIAYYEDNDGDGHGDPDEMVLDCAAPADHVENATDCDDNDDDISGGAQEICDELDNDCDGETDEDDAEGAPVWYEDRDQDTHGDEDSTMSACGQPEGYVSGSDDCDDLSATVYPGATEYCNEQDDDCDGDTDEGLLLEYYPDGDEDGYGDGTSPETGCLVPAGYTLDDADCNDAEENIHPDAEETCDDVDNNCDGDTDEGLLLTYYADVDDDGFGDLDSQSSGCALPDGFSFDATDCNDEEPEINPDAEDICDDVDDDCDGVAGTEGCTDCSAILDQDPEAEDGVYTIDIDGDGGEPSFDAYCDMTTDGGGWTLWWWYEADNTLDSQSDMLGGELWDCDPTTDTSCYAIIPTTPSELLVYSHDGNSATWEFDSGNSTSNKALAAFTERQTTAYDSSLACGNNWNPIRQSGSMTDNPYSCDEYNNSDPGCDCFWYDDYSGIYSFYLDDDTGWGETAFGAGYDNSNTAGVDSLEITSRQHSQSNTLHLYWR